MCSGTHPTDLVDLEQALLHGGGPDVPGRARVVQERRAATVTERISVLHAPGAQEHAAIVEVLHDPRIGVLHEEPADERRPELVEPPRVVDGLEDRPALRASHRQVFGAERGSHVNDPRPVVHGHEGASHDDVGTFDVRIRGLVPDPHEIGSRMRRDDLALFAEDAFAERLTEHEPLAVSLHHDVGRVGVDRETLVGRKRPRRRRPSQERRADERRVGRLEDGEPQEDAGVLDRPIAHGHFGVRERGPAARAVRGDLVGFHQQPALMELFERPPHGLDVLGVHGPVRIGHVDPEADPGRQSFELPDVSAHRFATQLVEPLDPERLDIALAGRADGLLDLQLHREAVTVPAAFARHEVPRHRLETRVDVLEHPSLDVMDARVAVRGRGSLVEDPEGTVLPQLDAAGEHVGVPPELEDAPLELREADLRVHRFEPLHPHRLLPRPRTRKRLVPGAGTRRWPRGTTPLAGRLGARPLTAAITASRCHGRGPAASTAGSPRG